MQSVSNTFIQKAVGPVRGMQWRVLISILKEFDDNITFFTIGESTIGGNDIIAGDNAVVQEWDKYTYLDFGDRLKSLEYTRESEAPTNALTMAMADIVLDNHDDIFTPENTSSPYYGYLKAQRPIKLFLGFKGAENIPMFVGITESRPQVDEKSKTVKLHCIDFLRSIYNITLEEEIIYENMRTDEIISALLQSAGLLTSQFELDYGTVTIPFAYFKKDSKLGDALKKIAESELGSLSMDEAGVIRFINRTNWNEHSLSFAHDTSTVIESDTLDEDKIINVVEITARPRAVQANQLLWESASAIEVPANGTVEVFANFKDEYGDLPVTTVDDPDYITSASTSLFATNDEQDGSGATQAGSVTLTISDQFSTAFRMEFTNTASVPVYITQLELWARPAKVTNDIFIRLQDDASVGTNNEGFDERVFKLDNDYIQDEGAANSIAQMILADRAGVEAVRNLLVKGMPHQQIGDLISYRDRKVNDTYFVTRINGILNSSGFRQKIMIAQRTQQEYFRIGISTIGGDDPIGP